MITRKKALVAIALFLIAAISSFHIAEIITRRYNPQNTYKLAKSRTFAIFKEHESMPFTLRPNVRNYEFTGKTVEFTNRYNTNEFGFRGDEIRKEKPEGVFRILMLGDSMTLGWGVEDSETFSAVTEDKLNDWAQTQNIDKRFEVINAGFTAGRSLDSYYVYVRNEADYFDPDLIVINHFPYNDYAPDMSESKWEGEDENGLPLKVYSNYFDIKNGYQVDKYKESWQFEIPFLRNTHSGILLMDSMNRYTPSLVNFVKKSVLRAPQKPKLIASGEIAFCLSNLLEKYCLKEMRDLYDKGKPLLLGIDSVADENSSSILVSIFPSSQEIEYLHTDANYEAYLAKSEPYNDISQFLEDNKIKFINFLPYFATSNYKEYYYPLDGHLNKEGHRLSGEIMVDYIINELLDSK